MIIYGKIAVLEALKSEKTFNRLLIDKNLKDKTTQELIDLARQQNVKIDFLPREALEKKVKSQAEGKINHQGIVAEVTEFEYSSIQDIIELARQKNEAPFVVILDGVEDPHNLGAIIRTAECAGAHGVIIPERRACSVNETVLKTSAGAASNVLIARVNNLSNAIEELKGNGVWVYAVEVGGENLFKANLKGAIALVLGSEGKGVSRLVKENCDGILTIPMFGKINSLNVSVAAAISIFEVVKQK